MNYINIIDTIKDISIKHQNVKQFNEGDVYEILNSGEHQYPAIVLTIQSVDTSAEDSFATLNGNIFYIDRLLQDSSNKLQILTLGISTLALIQAKIEENLGYAGIFQLTYNVFTEKFADLCAGVYQNVQIQYLKDADCDNNIFEINKLEIKANGIYDVNNVDVVDVNVIDEEAHKRIEELENDVDALEDVIADKDIEIYDLKQDNEEKDRILVKITDSINADREVSFTEAGNYVAEDKLGWNVVKVDMPLGDVTMSATAGVHGQVTIDTPEGYAGFKKAHVYLITPTEEKTYDITENGTTVILPRTGAEGGGWKALTKATINVNVPSVEAVEITQAEYDALEEYDDYKIYLIVD